MELKDESNLKKEGITEKQIEELIAYSNSDELVKKNTGDLIRFKDRANFDKWARVERKIYTLANSEDELLGIVWFRTMALPLNKKFILNFDKEKYGITFAIRIYGKARGKGYAEEFLNWALDKYLKTKDYLENDHKGFFLETRKDNLAAIKLYSKFGFKVVSKPDKNERVIMIQS